MGSEVFCSDQFLLAHQLCSATIEPDGELGGRLTAAELAARKFDGLNVVIQPVR